MSDGWTEVGEFGAHASNERDELRRLRAAVALEVETSSRFRTEIDEKDAELSRLRAEVERLSGVRDIIRKRYRAAEARADRLAGALKRVETLAGYNPDETLDDLRGLMADITTIARAALQAEPSPPSPGCPHTIVTLYGDILICDQCGDDPSKPPIPEPAGEACSTCGGSKTVIVWFDTPEGSDNERKPCPACDGTGRGA